MGLTGRLFTAAFALTAFAGALAAPAACRAGEAADLIIVGVSAQAQKANGDKWDVGNGKPDLKVYVSRPGFSHTTPARLDSYDAIFMTRSMRVASGDTLRVIVYDQDVFDDDIVGSEVITVTDAMIRKGVLKLQFGQVLNLDLAFRPL